MAVCWLSARTCSLLLSSFCFSSPPDVRVPIAHLSRASRKRAPEARHPLAQPVRAGLKGKRMASTVGAAPNQKHVSDQTRLRVSSTTQQTPPVLPLSRRSDVKTCKRSDDLRPRHCSSQSMVGHVAESLPPARVVKS